MIGKLLNLRAGHFKLNHVEIKPEALILSLESRSKRCRCPLCHKYSYSIHSKYQRNIQDLPCFAHKTQIQLIARKFYCHNPHCPQKIFTERFGESIAPYKRMTNRLCELLSSLCLRLNGCSAERLCHLLHIEISDTSLTRILQHNPLPELKTPKVLGVDDWAGKKRKHYGTILVDLEHHKIVDLLCDRETMTLKKWLEEHPGVEIVSRDRYPNYSNAITAALPQARQVVDRWHLLKNLGDALQKLMERNRYYLKHTRHKGGKRNGTYSKDVGMQTRSVSKNYAHRKWQFDQIKVLHQKGYGIKSIARTLQMARVTVRKYLCLQEPPPKRGSYVQVNIAQFAPYLRERVLQVPDIEMMQLYKEIKARGYNGGRSQAYEHLHQYVNRSAPRASNTFYLPSKIRMLLLRKPEELSPKERKLLKRLYVKCPQIKQAHSLASEFRKMMEQKEGTSLHSWIENASQINIAELNSFANGLVSDFEAVKNALTMPWSNGQVEGQINKLKTIKRQMYGRASFDLLRRRLLLDSS